MERCKKGTKQASGTEKNFRPKTVNQKLEERYTKKQNGEKEKRFVLVKRPPIDRWKEKIQYTKTLGVNQIIGGEWGLGG